LVPTSEVEVSDRLGAGAAMFRWMDSARGRASRDGRCCRCGRCLLGSSRRPQWQTRAPL